MLYRERGGGRGREGEEGGWRGGTFCTSSLHIYMCTYISLPFSHIRVYVYNIRVYVRICAYMCSLYVYISLSISLYIYIEGAHIRTYTRILYTYTRILYTYTRILYTYTRILCTYTRILYTYTRILYTYTRTKKRPPVREMVGFALILIL